MTLPTPSQMTLALVVPCYNEELRLEGDAFLSALDAYPWLSLCFVDDGSTDRTRHVLQELSTRRPGRIDVLVLPGNCGKGEAVRQGLLHVSSRSPLCGFWDADLAAPLTELSAMRAALQVTGVEWVWGIRLRSLGRRIERRAPRHYLGRGFATVASITLGIDAYDTQCGAKLFRVSPLLEAVLSQRFMTRWIFDLELLARANQLRPVESGSWIVELPLTEWKHQAGSKVRAKDFLRAAADLLLLIRHYSRPRTGRSALHRETSIAP